MTDKKNLKKKVNGFKIAKELYRLQKTRIIRLKKIVKALKDELKDFNINETELEAKALGILHSNKLNPDIEEARYMAVLNILSERN